MDIRFDEKGILISGAAGHLGRQLVKDYCSSGAKTLVLLDTLEHKNDLLELKEEYSANAKVYVYTADFRNVEEIVQVVEDIEKKGIIIDVLINNAGINILKKPGELTEDVWDYVLDVNLKGSFFLTKEVGRMSLINRKGNVIFISSQHGVVGNTMRSAYCSSKTGILGLMRALTADWSVFGVRVNAISPTFIINEANEGFLMNPREKRNMLNKIPLHKYATVSDISNAVLFLSSEKAGMITGHNLVVDGGYTCV